MTNDELWDLIEARFNVNEALLRSIISSLNYNVSMRKNVKAGTIEIKRSADAEFIIYGLGDLTGRTKLYFTVKKMSEKDSATDAQSIIQIEETAGLRFINKNVAGTPGNASIVVDNEIAGQITISIEAVETNKLSPNELYCYDIKKDNTVLAEGKFLISTAITRTLI